MDHFVYSYQVMTNKTLNLSLPLQPAVMYMFAFFEMSHGLQNSIHSGLYPEPLDTVRRQSSWSRKSGIRTSGCCWGIGGLPWIPLYRQWLSWSLLNQGNTGCWFTNVILYTFSLDFLTNKDQETNQVDPNCLGFINIH